MSASLRKTERQIERRSVCVFEKERETARQTEKQNVCVFEIEREKNREKQCVCHRESQKGK